VTFWNSMWALAIERHSPLGRPPGDESVADF